MKRLEVFDPAMCCSTGVCGTGVDPALVRFASDLEWLAGQGVSVRRYNLAQEPGEFAGRPVVAAALQNGGDASLPLITVDGTAVSEGEFPSRARLAEWAEVHLGTAEAPRSATFLPVVQSCCGGEAQSASGSGDLADTSSGCC